MAIRAEKETEGEGRREDGEDQRVEVNGIFNRTVA